MFLYFVRFANITMNSTTLYLCTCRQILLSGNSDQQPVWTDLSRLLPYLRQSLACHVCERLLVDPHSPIDGNCEHHICKNCRSGKMKLKQLCPWCSNHETFVPNQHLKIIIQCYQKMCEYLIGTPIYSRICSMNAGGGSSSSQSNNKNIARIIQEGAAYLTDKRAADSNSDNASTLSTDTDDIPTMSSLLNGNMPPAYKIKHPSATPSRSTILASPTTSDSNESEVTFKNPVLQTPPKPYVLPKVTAHTPPGFSTPKAAKKTSKPKPKKKGCRCGNATALPGKLTCCGQRCPCYVEGKGCFECKCRGCRNPHKNLVGTKKNLEQDLSVVGSSPAVSLGSVVTVESSGSPCSSNQGMVDNKTCFLANSALDFDTESGSSSPMFGRLGASSIITIVERENFASSDVEIDV